ncbi:ERF family protein [Shewanella sp.]|uniref:ERF family protein n=1 Tax=Shewanella sp. TaxID=50422 RepID=UPI004048E5B6
MNNIAKAFVAAKREFAPALKTSTNPHFKSKYADLAGCLEAVNEALLNQGIALLQETSEDATGVTVETVFMHESGETIRGGKLHVPASKQDPQGYGSALTYARRYSVMAACGIAAEDDDGNAASRKAPTVDVSTYVSSINGCENLEDLKAKFAIAITACGTDLQAKAKVIAAKDARKADL